MTLRVEAVRMVGRVMYSRGKNKNKQSKKVKRGKVLSELVTKEQMFCFPLQIVLLQYVLMNTTPV